MKKSFLKIIEGYKTFQEKYAVGDQSIMRLLSHEGQKPEIMVVACCDSRVDPALIFQCAPGDLFVVRNVANIVPPYEKDEAHHGTSAALEFGINFLKVKHLILLGHSQCGGIEALLNNNNLNKLSNDFINNWVSLIKPEDKTNNFISPDEYAKLALHASYENCMTFPWIKEKVMQATLIIHRWFFDIKQGKIFTYNEQQKTYHPLEIY